MDGMKLDEEYRRKNGLGPSEPSPKPVQKTPINQRYTLDTANSEDKKPPKTPVLTKTEDVVSEKESPEEVGFIDKVLLEKDAPKAKKIKKAKPPKIPKPKITAKPEKVKEPKVVKSEKPKAQPVPPKKVEQSKPESTRKTAVKSSSKKSLKIQLITVLKVAIFVALIAFSLYNFLEVQRLNDLLSSSTNQSSQNDAKNQELINTIGSFRLLPDSEYEIYTVKDKTKLANDPVFEYAENGDKVIVYPDDSLTIVFRESEGKIVGESKNSSLTENK